MPSKINLYIIARKIKRIISKAFSKRYTKYKFNVFGVTYSSFSTNGVPLVDIYDDGKLIIGDNFRMNNGYSTNLIGRQQPCFFIISNAGIVKLGNNVRISSTVFHCNKAITIGNNVVIGGNTVIYDTDFHSINYVDRNAPREDIEKVGKADVFIDDNVFIGAHTTILKGVKIGKNSVIGACSVVTKNIPENQIWAGNPAQFIKNI